MGLKVSNVDKSFSGKKAVDNISFEIDKPGVFGLLGTNGAGKTTTIRMLLGIINKDKGLISWNGKDVKRKHVNFGYMPEERGVYPKTKIFDQLMYFAELKGMRKSKAEEAIKYWLKKLEIEEYINMPAEKLSKGNQQKVQFVIAVMHDPELIVLDEPFSGLDPVNTELLKKIILELVKMGKYIIMSSHQMTSIEEFCTDILILNRGKTILKGNLKTIKNSYPANKLEIVVNKNIDKEIENIGFHDYENIDNRYSIVINSEEKANILFKNLALVDDLNVIKFELKKPSLNDIFIEKVGVQK
ncbi:MAG: ATP-binding cassette domain-containing protein [Clostridia bacterium]|nr:ATP-binding cassette domain-containing protein [Clostridia bacterium]